MLTASLTAVVASAHISGVDGSKQQTHGSSTRKSIDPPTRPVGKLGQDLFIAVGRRDTAEIDYLLSKGADPNSHNGLEFTPLYIAAASHQLDVMQKLIKAGARPDEDSTYGTPLMFAASSAHLEGAQLLLSLGANVNAARTDGFTVLMMAAKVGAPPMIAELLKNKAHVNEVDNNGMTALNVAATMGHLPACLMLLGAGAKVDQADDDLRTPLMGAAKNGQAEVVKLLLKAGAKPNARDSKGRTALMLAARYGDFPEVVKALIAGGASKNLVDKSGQSAADAAQVHEYAGCYDLLGKGSKDRSTKNDPTKAAAAGIKAVRSSIFTFNQRANCVSCHHEGLGRIAVNVANQHGLGTTPSFEKVQIARIRGMVLGMQPLHEQAIKNPEAMKLVPLYEISEVTPAYAWVLGAMAMENRPIAPALTSMAMVLAKQQSPEGFWFFGAPRGPMQSSYLTFTALSIKALQTYGGKANAKEIDDRIQKAKSWLLTTEVKTNEDRAGKLLGLKWSGASDSDLKAAAAAILANQRPDGGWSPAPNLPSDAYATGQALYVLHKAGGLPVNDAVYKKGVNFLVRTQDDDGSWFVNKVTTPGNNHFDGGFPHGLSQYSSFNGTCWATMALMETMPSKSQKVALLNN